MQPKYSIRLKDIFEEHDLVIVYPSTDFETVTIVDSNVVRPSLQLVGFYDYFQAERIRVWGKSETAFLATLPKVRQAAVINELFSRKIPAMVVCNGVEPHRLVLEAARRYDVTLLKTDMDTGEIISRLSYTLRGALAPRCQVHGVFVQVYGEGLLITGDSGIGKSEVALELIKRGHRLVADDAVELRRVSYDTLMGSAPKMIRYLMELRGVGLIDIRRLFGIGAVIPSNRVDLVVDFVHWEENAEYDRLGLEDETISFLDVTVPKITVPVAAARNLAIILEVAAMNHRQKKLGYNTAKAFLERYDSSIDGGDSSDFDD